MAKNEVTYQQLERRAVLDLAARTWADRAAPREHVEAARRVLERPGVMPDMATTIRNAKLRPDEIREMRALLASWRARRAAGGSDPGPEPLDPRG